eukprot:m.15032 g.15032  ORF g.15032 m.15032 type:complete len:483 (-) comp7800_c0_seq1:29-1477(-)
MAIVNAAIFILVVPALVSFFQLDHYFHALSASLSKQVLSRGLRNPSTSFQSFLFASAATTTSKDDNGNNNDDGSSNGSSIGNSDKKDSAVTMSTPHHEHQHGKKFDDLKFQQIHLRKAGGRTLHCTFADPFSKHEFSFLEFFQSSTVFRDAKSSSNRAHVTFANKKTLDQWKEDPSTFVLLTVREPVSRIISAFVASLGALASQEHFTFATNMRSLHSTLWLTPPTVTDDQSTSVKCGSVAHLSLCGDAIEMVRNSSLSLEKFARVVETEPSMNYQAKTLAFLPNRSRRNRLFRPQTAERDDIIRSRAISLVSRYIDAFIVTERYNESIAVLNCLIKDRTGHEMQNLNICANFNPHVTDPDEELTTEAIKEEGQNGEELLSEEGLSLLRKRNSIDTEVFSFVNKMLDFKILKVKGRSCYTRVIDSLSRCHIDFAYVQKRTGKVLHHPPLTMTRQAREAIVRQGTCPIAQEEQPALNTEHQTQ